MLLYSLVQISFLIFSSGFKKTNFDNVLTLLTTLKQATCLHYNMKYHQIDNTLFKVNRRNFAERMKPNSIAIFVANDMMPRSADGFFEFRQNPDLFYLTGVDQEETYLIIYPDAPQEQYKEMLFVKETNEYIKVWEGEKLTKEKARDFSGVTSVHWSSSFKNVLPMLMKEASNVYLGWNEHDRFLSKVLNQAERFAKEVKAEYPLHEYERAAPIMEQLRAKKHSIEIDLMQQACDITEKGFRRVLEFVKPGVWEYEIEAELAHEFLNNRATGHAYHPIIASGADSCVLHYNKNNKQCQDGDVLLFDFGCEYANYASDLSRTIPVNGKFTDRQKDVYNACLNVMKAATFMLRPGNNLNDYHKEVGKLMESELIGLGLLDKDKVAAQDPKAPLYKKYFPHGTSHYIGIDTHDVGSRFAKFEEGFVFTCEPGIYIPEENIGIRIENDIVITAGEPHDLMGNIPREVEEIEDLMNQ